MRDPVAMRDRYKRIAFRYRNFPGQHGLRPHTVEIRLKTWSGSHTGDGTASGSFTQIVERDGLPPKIRWLTEEELVVGGLDAGTVEIGPITPDFSGGGTPAGTIRGVSLTTGGQLQFRVTGPMHPNGAIYESVRVDFGRSIHYMFRARPVSDS